MSERRISEEAKKEIVERCEEGRAQREVAKMYAVSESCVSKILSKSRFEAIRKKKGTPSPNRGRPRLLDLGEMLELKKIAEDNPYECSEVFTEKLAKKINKKISRWTARRYLKNFEVSCRPSSRKPLLTARHRKLRLAWAKKFETWTLEDWMNVLFSDETTVELTPSRRIRKCYRTPQQKYLSGFMTRTVKHPERLTFWGCFGNGKVGPLQFLTGSINSQTYVAILRSCLADAKAEVFENGEFIFQQDNAPCHVSKTTRRWFSRSSIDTLSWPPQSPDLNPIENLWEILKRQVYAKKEMKNLEDLQKHLQECWMNISMGSLVNLINSMPSRVKQVIKNHGGSTKF